MQCTSCGQINDPGMRFCVSCGNSLQAEDGGGEAEAGDLEAGRVLKDTYELIRLLGEGGAGAVYEGRHVHLGHAVAVKVLFAQLARINQIRERFVEEGRIQANLRHPNIVAVSDIVDENGLVAIVMEYISGPTLHAFIQGVESPVAVNRAVHIMLRLLAGLGAAHDRGIVHRDIKPGNIMLAETEQGVIPKICDFGIAKVASSQSRTITGTKMGTLHYMAPEQFKDAGRVDRRADIYSLGVTFYELLTGRLPFETENDYTLMRAHLEVDPPSMRGFRPDIPSELDKLVLKALAKKPEDRFESCDTFARNLIGLPGFETLKGFSSSPGVSLDAPEGTSVPNVPASLPFGPTRLSQHKPGRARPEGPPRRQRSGEPPSLSRRQRPRTDSASSDDQDAAKRQIPWFPIFLAVFALALAGAATYYFAFGAPGQPGAESDPANDQTASAAGTGQPTQPGEADAEGLAVGGEGSGDGSGQRAQTQPLDPSQIDRAFCQQLITQVERLGLDRGQPADDADQAELQEELEVAAVPCRELMVSAAASVFDEVYAHTQADQLDIARHYLRGALDSDSDGCLTLYVPANRVYNRGLQRIQEALNDTTLANYERDSLTQLGRSMQDGQSRLQTLYAHCL